MEAHYYNVNLKWIADRKGKMVSAELNDTIEVATPPQFRLVRLGLGCSLPVRFSSG